MGGGYGERPKTILGRAGFNQEMEGVKSLPKVGKGNNG